jgi:hypothetical protein
MRRECLISVEKEREKRRERERNTYVTEDRRREK